MLRDAKKKQTKDLIIRNAMGLFKEKGYDQVTVEEIAAMCGIAKGTFFNYFPKKEHLLLEVSGSYMPLLSQWIGKHREGPLKERLLLILREVLGVYVKHAGVLRVTLIETIRAAMESGSESSNLILFQEAIRSVLEEARKEGSLRMETDCGSLASVIVGVLVHTVVTRATCLDPDELMKTLRLQLDLIWGGIGRE
ncbi:TetR/AcrR family transcriptional regulator [Gorillibacterium sp. sgz5001074]|uniref:TetR/AcrR family transcriptional regulator n=1 Tax=Gorillibacterium sp. sgz5001074 TaxID=3446695 RepID=UPI003F67764F